MYPDKITSIELKNIHKRHDAARFILHIERLEFNNRNINVITGANGSGKSTLLKLIGLLEGADEGSVLFNGTAACYDRSGCRALRKRIGFVMQNPYLFNMNVFENIALGLRIRKYQAKEIVSKVNKIMFELNIAHLAGRRIKGLSRGEYQKVAIAQVLVLEPDIILMDEPAANIDRESVLSMEDTVKSIQRRSGSIIIMTTHSPAQACRMSPDIISIRNGKIVDSIYEETFFGPPNLGAAPDMLFPSRTKRAG